MKSIARRKFVQMTVAAAAGCIAGQIRPIYATDLPHLSEEDPMAKSMKYTHDASSVDPATRSNPAEVQTCANCALAQVNDGESWIPCQIFPGKVVNSNGWCSVWAPRT